MKLNPLLIPAVTLLLSACKPQTGTVIPVETVSSDTVSTDTATIKSDYFKINFISEDAEKRFFQLFSNSETTGLTLDTVKIDNTTIHQIALTSADLIPLEDEPIIQEHDLTQAERPWDSEGSVKLLSTLPLSLFQLSSFFSSSDSLYSIEREDNTTYTVSGQSGSFDAVAYINELTRIAEERPILISSLWGEIDGLREFSDQTSRTISGIAPISPTKLAVKTAVPFEPKLEQLSLILPGDSEGYKVESIENASGRSHQLTAGIGQYAKPHIKSISIDEKNDGDPIIELSTGNYNGALLYRNSDIRVVKSRLTNMTITPVDTLTVFAITNMNEPAEESSLASLLAPGALKNALPFQSFIAETLLPTDIPKSSFRQAVPPVITERVTVLADEKNHLEYSVAKELVNFLQQKGIFAELSSLNNSSFGKKAYYEEYQIMICSIPGKVRNSPCATQLLKTLYNSKTKTPLLHVPLFLAADSKLKLTGNNLSSIVKLK